MSDEVSQHDPLTPRPLWHRPKDATTVHPAAFDAYELNLVCAVHRRSTGVRLVLLSFPQPARRSADWRWVLLLPGRRHEAIAIWEDGDAPISASDAKWASIQWLEKDSKRQEKR